MNRGTWGEGDQCIFFFVGLSEEKSVNEQIEYENDAEEDLIIYPSTDTYQNLTYKVSEYFISKNFNFINLGPVFDESFI